MNHHPHRLKISGYGRYCLVLIVLVGLIAINTGCSLPFTQPKATQPSESATGAPTVPAGRGPAAAVSDLPPVVVEADPLPSSSFPLAGPLTLHFSQPMDTESVEAAFKVEPTVTGSFVWDGDRIVRFWPETVFQPGTEVRFTVETGAKGTNGKALLRPAEFLYQTPGDFLVVERLPEPGARDLDPTAAIAVTFNQPVVPLGGDAGDLPPAFTLEPAAAGTGEWLNTSTYVFYGEPALQGGVEYTVQINPDLTSTVGVHLTDDDQRWTFTTSLPRLLKVEPDGTQPVHLDAPFTLTFNQPMDRASVEANVALVDAQGQRVRGTFEWSENDTVLTFQPEELLKRSGAYTLRLADGAQGLGGTPVESPFELNLTAVPELAVAGVEPALEQGLNVSGGYGFLTIRLTSPLSPPQDFEDLLTITPDIPDKNISLAFERDMIYVSGAFAPNTYYTVRLSPELTDEWGDSLSAPVELQVRTLPVDPSFSIPILQVGANSVFVPAGEASIPAQATNLTRLDVATRPADLSAYLSSLEFYSVELEINTTSGWAQSIDLPPNEITPIEIALNPDGQPLAPGLYLYHITAPEEELTYTRVPFYVVVSRYQLALKVAPDAVTVWAVDLRDDTPAAGLPLQAFAVTGTLLGEAVTDANGLALIDLPENWRPSDSLVVVSGQPGEDDFALSASVWNQGLAGWDFGLPANYWEAEETVYVYTDRPIYRPGQTVYFRLVGLRPGAGGFQPMTGETLRVHLQGTYSPVTGEVPLIETAELTLSSFGTAHGEFTIPEDAISGEYALLVDDHPSSSITVYVADYRKPEIDLSVSFTDEVWFTGDNLSAEIEANYFFGGPAGNVPVRWQLFARPETMDLPGRLQMGRLTDLFAYPEFFLWWDSGMLLVEGEATTGADGRVDLTINSEEIAQTLPDVTLQQLTLEVTLADESRQQVTARAEAQLFSGEHLIGVEPETWTSRAGEEVGFTVQTFDWQVNPVSDLPLQAVFERVAWKQKWINWQYGQVSYEPEYTRIASADLVTGPDGVARIAFTPDAPGTYQLTVEGAGTATEVLVWVAGEGTAVWPDLANQHLRLESDRTSYAPGENASVFVPNPFEGGALAWITVERDRVTRSQVVALDGASYQLDLPLGPEDAPNVYVSVTLIGRNADGRPDFRMGYLELSVEPVQQTLQLELTADPQTAGPGDRVQFRLEARDSFGRPVQGEFSLAVVDEAIFALREPNAPPILEGIYGRQPLRISSSLSLAVYAGRISMPPLGGGGGGGGMPFAPQVRTDFQDTAYWTGTLTTGEDGTAVAEVVLPDNLTTWVALARGLDGSVRVGETEARVTVSQPLLVRPVTPPYFVAGDRVQLGAIVHNNTDRALTAQVEIQATGFALSDGQNAQQTVEIPAGGRQAVYWWGQVMDAEAVALRFSAVAGEFTDIVTPEGGSLPVLRYVTPQTFTTAGILSEGGETLEVVSLPASFDPQGGRLVVEMNTTLAGAVVSGLDALEAYPYDHTEPVISRLLANLQVKLATQQLPSSDSDLQSRLDAGIRPNLEWLLQHQNSDGGWGWLPGRQSDTYLSAYGLLALARARQSGEAVDSAVLSAAQNYLLATLTSPEMAAEDWQLDRLAFVHFALAESGLTNVPPGALFPFRERLSPWGKAFLAVSLMADEANAEQVRTLVADLETSAVRSASGAHWESAPGSGRVLSNSLSSTAVVIYALAKIDPASPLLADAVRYLVAHYRSVDRAGSFGMAWALLALTEFMEGTGEVEAGYDFDARLNDAEIASGQARGLSSVESVRTEVSVNDLAAGAPNGLVFSRTDGPGRLYYRADLEVGRPVDSIPPLERGLSVEREYFLGSEDCRPGECTAVDRVSLGEANPVVLVRLTLTLPSDMRYLVVEDFAPAGAEIVNPALDVFQTFDGEIPQIDDRNPFGEGWGWWYFSTPNYRSDRVTWLAEFVPAGTYQLVYRLLPHQAGEFHALPARAWQTFFPEVQGSSSGAVLVIEE